MKFSEAWLREWVNPPVDSAELRRRLTMAGLEVDGCESVAADFTGVRVAEVVAAEPHPAVATLRVCRIRAAGAESRAVCGAPNVTVGLKAAYAPPGARLPAVAGGEIRERELREITAAEIRGVESVGMLCSAAELGMAETSIGLLELPEDAPLGADLREFLALDDHSIALDLTPNRGDCLGMLGIARDLGAVFDREIQQPPQREPEATIADKFPVRISAGNGCPRYLGRIIRGIDLEAETPLWMREKLRRGGLRCIDPVVDVTNFVLLELGQPLHAFDFEKLRDGIDVRLARPGEQITLLDGKLIELQADALVIADGEGAVAMAGVMGGLRTAVGDKTRDVFLECAAFAPAAIAGRARGLGLQTDASQRYERGVDYQLQGRAMARATELLLEICGGRAGPVTAALGEIPETRRITLRYATVRRLLGIDIPRADVLAIFQRLGFVVLQQNGAGITMEVPSHRFDIAIEADLIEEIARIHGYDKLPPAMGLQQPRMSPAPEGVVGHERMRAHLAALGYQEIITYSFIDPRLAAAFSADDVEPVELQNPISQEMSIMRGSLLPGLVQTLRQNLKRRREDLRLFESGLVFARQTGGFRQQTMLAGLICGAREAKNWSHSGAAADFYDIKGDLESLFGLGGGSGLTFTAAHHPGLHPGQCAEVLLDGEFAGVVGALHPGLRRTLELPLCFVFEARLDALRRKSVPVASEPSRYPEVNRDLSVVVAERFAAAEIEHTAREAAGPLLTSLRVLDVYRGGAVPAGDKSITLGLTWQHPSRTLDDHEIDRIIDSAIKRLEEKFNASLRS